MREGAFLPVVLAGAERRNAMAKPDNAGAGATDYMHLFGLVVLGYMWARIVIAANEAFRAQRRWIQHEQASLHAKAG